MFELDSPKLNKQAKRQAGNAFARKASLTLISLSQECAQSDVHDRHARQAKVAGKIPERILRAHLSACADQHRRARLRMYAPVYYDGQSSLFVCGLGRASVIGDCAHGDGIVVRSFGARAPPMREYRFTSKVSEPRVLCVSIREIAPEISRCIRYEFEDLAGEVDEVDVIAPVDTHENKPKFVRTLWRLSAKAFRRFAVKVEGIIPIARLWRLPPGVTNKYDLVVVSAEKAQDLYDIGPCAMWTSTARASACYIQELYASDVAGLGNILTLLKNFDHIFLGAAGTVDLLAEATGRPCHYLVPHTDTIKFNPYPEAPTRVIDFYAMGRRPPETHEALLLIAGAHAPNWYYMYDTVTNCPVTGHAEHRQRLADMIMRSRLFLVNTARFDDPERTAGQQELGYRFIEGAAGGAVLVGDSPDNDTFDAEFGWEDSVIHLPYDSGDIAEVIAALDADPIRVERISKTNVVNSLRRHDHVYRWGAILAVAGLEETVAMASRRRTLAALADSIEQTIPGTP